VYAEWDGLRDVSAAVYVLRSLIMAEEIITCGGTDRGYMLCNCNECGIVARCTPAFDFYTMDNDGMGPLFCETCFGKAIRRGGVNDASKEE
jgi:hypothetical protein